MKLFLSAVIFICLQHTIDALDCYTCTNATYVSECKATTTCNAGEVCFSDYTQTSNGVLFSFGCRLETKCQTLVQNGNNGGSGSIVGRSGVTGPCSECCKEQRCNRQLCQHSFSAKECVDSQDIHCTSVGALVDICADTEKAKTLCRRFCGLCDYVNGDWSSWFQWSECQITCGTGTQSRTRNCSEPEPSGGGHTCVGASTDTRSCTKEPCPIHGSWADWAAWGSCSATCGIGLKRRDRTCSNPYPARYGDHCFGDARDDQVCLASACAATNGGWGSWKSWTSCTATCNGGIQSRQRHCDNPKPSADGDFCDGSPLDVQQCNQQQCSRIKASFSVQTATRGTDGILRFSSVVLNEGSYYDTTTGVFTCHYPGLYAFIANIVEGGSGNNFMYCYIRRNSSDLSYMLSRQGKIDGKYAVDGYGTATGAATVRLVKGDRVYVYCRSITGTSLSASSFTGFLISTDP